MSQYQQLAELLFPHVTQTPQQLMANHPRRQLPEGAKVTRVAPSPTGFVHLGTYYQALIDERLAHTSGGVFYIRVEDTDAKREVAGTAESIAKVLAQFGVVADEGVTHQGEVGAYGPYYQSKRADIYHVFAKQLVLQGDAYPCFCTEERLARMRSEQEQTKENFGYWGKYAACRDLSLEQVKANLQAGLAWVLRFRSNGNCQNKIKFTDGIKGNLELTENDMDHVLLKADGIPTYHFAHVCDDYFMGTTHVVRGEEWLSTLPFHLQVFKALEIKPPKYLHTAHLMKLEGETGKRKLSKRKDPEAAMSYYEQVGIPAACVIEYIMTLANSNFEEWRAANPDADYKTFPFSPKKMSVSGCLVDTDKLKDVCKNTIARMSAKQVADGVTLWAKENDPAFYEALAADPQKTEAIFAIGRGGKKPRKDLSAWQDAKEYMGFFFAPFLPEQIAFDAAFDQALTAKVLQAYLAAYNPQEDGQAWFERVKALSNSLGFAGDMKAWKAEPQNYLGHVGDVSGMIRRAITGKENSPDLFTVMQLLGADECQRRLQKAIDQLNS